MCTSWLAGLQPGAGQVPVWVQKGALRLPPSPATPLLLIGPGTGVAPFRSFLQERQAMAAAGAVTATRHGASRCGCKYVH